MPHVRCVHHSDCLQLEQFMPIPYGGLKLIAGLFSCLILEAAVGLDMYFVLRADALAEGTRVMIVVCGGGFLLMAIPIYFITGKRGDWIRSYFSRNVRGYVARFWVNEDVFKQKWCCDVYLGSTENFAPPLGYLALEMRLGGWISTIGNGINQGAIDALTIRTLRNWRVRLHKIRFHTGAVLVTIEYTSPLRDGRYEEIVLEVSEAIQFLNFIQQASPNILSISHVLRSSMRSKDELTAEVEKARQELRLSTGRVAMFVDQLESFERRIEQTDRLRTTIEGLEIYLDVLGALRLAYHDVDQAKYGQVSDKLDQAKRDFDRLRSKRPRRSRGIRTVAR